MNPRVRRVKLWGAIFFGNCRVVLFPESSARDPIFFKILSYQVALFFESSAHDPIFLKILSSRIDLFPL